MEIRPDAMERMELDAEQLDKVSGGTQVTYYCEKCKANKRGELVSNGSNWKCGTCGRTYRYRGY